jgi:hypothetical protein
MPVYLLCKGCIVPLWLLRGAACWTPARATCIDALRPGWQQLCSNNTEPWHNIKKGVSSFVQLQPASLADAAGMFSRLGVWLVLHTRHKG